MRGARRYSFWRARPVERSNSPVASKARPTSRNSDSWAPVNGSVPRVFIVASGAADRVTGVRTVWFAPSTPLVGAFGVTTVCRAPLTAATPAAGVGAGVGVNGTGGVDGPLGVDGVLGGPAGGGVPGGVIDGVAGAGVTGGGVIAPPQP